MRGDGQGAFLGVPCETGELRVTWWLGTQGIKGQDGVQTQEESTAWHRMAWGYQQSAAWPLSCVDCAPFSRDQFEPEMTGSS